MEKLKNYDEGLPTQTSNCTWFEVAARFPLPNDQRQVDLSGATARVRVSDRVMSTVYFVPLWVTTLAQ